MQEKMRVCTIGFKLVWNTPFSFIMLYPPSFQSDFHHWMAVGFSQYTALVFLSKSFTTCNAAAYEESMLSTGHLISSSCTGVYTVECAAAILENIINSSNVLKDPVYWQSHSCFEPCPWQRQISLDYFFKQTRLLFAWFCQYKTVFTVIWVYIMLFDATIEPWSASKRLAG